MPSKVIVVKDVFRPYFARKSFAQIMFDEYDFSPELVAIFTGHSIKSSGSRILMENYLDTQSMSKKRKLFDKIKII